MNILLKWLCTALLVLVLANYMPGVKVNNLMAALGVAVTLSVLNVLVKPVLVMLTLPMTILSFGLFLLVINSVIIVLADFLLPTFSVTNFMTAFWFATILSVSQMILFGFIGKK